MQPLLTYLAHVADGRVSEVSLSGRHLGDEAMPSIVEALREAAPMVKVIDLEENNFTSIGLVALCLFLEKDESVREVNFANNKVSSVGAERVLKLLGANSTITAFSLARNDVADDLLAQIDYAASINSQPAALKKMLSRLGPDDAREAAATATTLDLSNSAGKISLQLLAQAVKDSASVEALSLARCGLGDPGLELVGEIINSRKSLKHVDLSGNGIGTHGCRVFADQLASNTTIASIILSGNKIADDAARLLIAALKVNDSIVEMDVSDNAITATTLGQLSRALEINRQPTALKRALQAMESDESTVTAIELQWHKNTSRAGYFLGPALRLSTHVTVLNLSNAALGCAGATDLAAGLRLNKHLERLELANNMIKDEGGIALLEAVRRHPTLREINLANNLLENPSGRAAVDMLGINDVLIAVNLELNQISDELMTEVEGLVTVNHQPLGIKRLLHRIEGNDPTLTTLDFSEYDGHRYHTSESVKVLCIALATNSRVEVLDLSNNGIGDIGAQFLADYIIQTTSLKTLRLNNVSISDRGAAFIIDALRANEVTSRVEMSQNALTDLTGQNFLSLLLTNTAVTSVALDRTRVSPQVQEDIRENAGINAEPLALKAALHALRSGATSAEDGAGGAVVVSSSSALVASKGNLTISLAAPADGQKASDDAIRVLCRELRGNSAVTAVDLSNNNVSLASIRHLAPLLFAEGNAIESLVLASNPTIDDACAAVLGEAIAKSVHLKSLDVRATGLTSEGLEKLVDALKVNNTVTAIRVNRDKFSSRALTALSRELALNTQVLSLKEVLPRIEGNDESLTALSLRGDGVVAVDDLSCQLLCLALQRNTTITHLDLSGNSITSAGVEYLVDMLQDNSTIRTIDLSENRIDDEGCQLLKTCLETNDAIISIELAGNHISEQDLTDLSYLIGINNGPLTLKAVMFALSNNDPKVTEVDFNGLHEGTRPFDDEAVHILCSLLVGNTHLTAIDLANNQITDVGAAIIADMLRLNSTLGAIYLENNHISRPGADALFQALKTNHTLHTLSLEGNSAVPAIALENLSSVLNVNKQPLKQLRRLGQRDVTMLDDATMFRDAGYMKDKEDEILEHAFVGAPASSVPQIIKMRQLKTIQ